LRRKEEILKLPIGELTDEEIVKAAMYRLDTKMATLIYIGEDDKVYYLTHWRNQIGRSYWNRIRFSVKLLFNRVWDKAVIRDFI
jgi:hypothetical protein